MAGIGNGYMFLETLRNFGRFLCICSAFLDDSVGKISSVPVCVYSDEREKQTRLVELI